MSFFSELAQRMTGKVSWTVKIDKTEAEIIVLLFPSPTVKDGALGSIAPIQLKAPLAQATDLDNEIWKHIAAPIDRIESLSVTVSQFEESMAAAEKENAITKAEKKKADDEKSEEQRKADKRKAAIATARQEAEAEIKNPAATKDTLADMVKRLQKLDAPELQTTITALQKKIIEIANLFAA